MARKKRKTTPARQQYLDMKANFPNAILFFRMGDFYEVFDEDAELVARELDITLTSRPFSKNDERVPMAGVPHHAAENYIARLVEKGYHVAVADQLGSEPVNGLVPREVSQVVTPGTVVSPSMLSDRQNNFLLALVPEIDYKGDNWSRAGLAYVDITTGEFAVTEVSGENAPVAVLEELARLTPREVLMPQTWVKRGVSMPSESHLTPLPDFQFDTGPARDILVRQFEVKDLEGFGLEDHPLALRAAGGIVYYLQETQRGMLEQLSTIHLYSTDGYMAIDAATRANLELTRSMRGGKAQGSLLEVLDRTVTSMGARLLRNWLGQPLIDIEHINARLDGVTVFFENGPLRAELFSRLRQIADMERLTNRIMMGRAGPREVRSLGDSLHLIPELRELIAPYGPLAQFLDYLNPLDEVTERIDHALQDDLPALMNQIGVIRAGYSDELDAIYRSSSEAREYVNNLEAVERKRTGIKSLKVGYNKVFGYYIEVSRATDTELIPDDYVRKQTLVNAERYITPTLKEYETLLLNAEEQALEIEINLFRELCANITSFSDRLLQIARTLAHLDVFAGLAEVAAREGYVRPVLAEHETLEISDGRHPVVERALTQKGERFVPNEVHFDPEQRILIVTGPNMSGKSVFMRQVAIITLLAQMGSYVPASEATIKPVDRIFARVGAQDEIYAGQSTFMVEMSETASILAHATPHSLVLLDEIGRGTSTYDGMAIARAVIEYIHNNPRLGCKTLFATHYHELTELEKILPCVRNYSVAVTEEGDHVVFLHRVVPGAADRSYGIYVAKLAGVPRSVVRRAEELLQELEAQSSNFQVKKKEKASQFQLSLFDDSRHPVIEALLKLDIEEMSPIDAITRLYELQRMVEVNGRDDE